MIRKAALALPVLALLLYADRVSPAPRAAPPPRPASGIAEACAALPARDAGRFGRPGDPLNLVFLGTEARIRDALEGGGWTSLPTTLAGSLRGGLKELLAWEALTTFPPMNDYRLLGRTQDMNWVRVVRPVQTRHHFRLWRTGVRWRDGREVWWGSGNYDLSVRWRDLSHRPDPEMDCERDYIAATLRGRPAVLRLGLVALPQIPLEGENDKGYPFRTDGRALLVELR